MNDKTERVIYKWSKLPQKNNQTFKNQIRENNSKF